MRASGRFVFYLCPLYFKRPHEMVETLVHEGSHHATAYTDDVDFRGSKAYGRRTCQDLAQAEPLKALKNADNFCYYIQDAASAVPDRPKAATSARCPSQATAKKPDNDGDCRCRTGSVCYHGGTKGCPFSATARRKVYSDVYFDAWCNGCQCRRR